MPGFSSIDRERFKEQVRASTDLAALVTESGVALKPGGGGRLKACCPFHHEKTPSFVVNGDAYHCFGCGAHGDCFSFLMQRDGLTFPEALEALANRAGIEIPKSFSRSSEAAAAAPRDTRERLLAANEFARSAYYKALRDEKVPGAAEARAYLEKRAIPMVAAADWGIGFAPDEWDFLTKAAGHPPVRDLDEAGLLSHNDAGRTYDRFRGRLMFPIRDANGKTVAFSGRILPQRDDGRTGKYVNSPETPVFKKAKVLFGLDRAREAIRSGGGTALLCEGQIDTIRLHLCGFTNAVAPQGTAFTPEQAHILKRYASNVILVLDGDTAGHKAALRDAGILFDVELSPSVVLLPSGEDPDTFLLNAGPDAFRALLDQAISPIRFLLSAFDTTSLQGVTAAKNALFELLAHVQSETLLDYALREAANLLHLSLGA
ncbi:MAG: DNA primase, partial [Bacteroidales bacterium]|nr:DNA primase [Bacteroidales bacterium]